MVTQTGLINAIWLATLSVHTSVVLMAVIVLVVFDIVIFTPDTPKTIAQTAPGNK